MTAADIDYKYAPLGFSLHDARTIPHLTATRQAHLLP
jgi:hypothetical protein